MECLHSPFCRGLKVFCFRASRWSLNRHNAVFRTISGKHFERSAYVETPPSGPVLDHDRGRLKNTSQPFTEASGSPLTLARLIMKAYAKDFEEQARTIESKRTLLAYLRSGPQPLTIESYLCLTKILCQAGWHFDLEHWNKNGKCLATLEAAISELEEQVAMARDRLLRQTVTGYATNAVNPESRRTNFAK